MDFRVNISRCVGPCHVMQPTNLPFHPVSLITQSPCVVKVFKPSQNKKLFLEALARIKSDKYGSASEDGREESYLSTTERQPRVRLFKLSSNY